MTGSSGLHFFFVKHFAYSQKEESRKRTTLTGRYALDSVDEKVDVFTVCSRDARLEQA